MGWSKVNVHLWVENGDDDVDITSWPGAEMTYDSTSGLYYYDVDVQYHGKEIGYIFNNGVDQIRNDANDRGCKQQPGLQLTLSSKTQLGQ